MTAPLQDVPLRNGGSAPLAVVRTTMLSLMQLTGTDLAGHAVPEADPGENLSNMLAVYELRELARDPRHEMYGDSGARLTRYGLLADGRLHDSTRAIVLSAIEGGMNFHLVSPLAEE